MATKTKSPYYRMKPVQVVVLRELASGQGVFTLVKPNEKSNKVALQDWKLTQDLLDLGLIEDVKASLNEEQLKRMTSKVPKGREWLIIGATKMGQLMFDYCDDPECKVHKKRLPC